ncbi:MAG: cob(I)yrinic acid a,c-diamide adenosyltransferase [Treponema sp.]|jgi:cob(I)alamin adenosyltransferase|nr:cob(I)yrinic acid a,c-diamide adenosyltransferase [Treponema sp.]
MSVYTGTGDTGETSVLSGRKVSKNDPIIHFIGACDELNSHLGLVKVMFSGEDARQSFIEEIQKKLMKLMSHACDTTNEKYFFTEDEVSVLEKEIDKLSQKLAKHDFVLPGRNITEAQIHIARAVARRAERLFFAANEKQQLCPKAGAYLNRLSGYLFVLSQQEF